MIGSRPATLGPAVSRRVVDPVIAVVVDGFQQLPPNVARAAVQEVVREAAESVVPAMHNRDVERVGDIAVETVR